MDWNSADITKLIAQALAEDVGTGDVTVAATIPPNAKGKARIIAKQELVCAGLPLAEQMFCMLDPGMDAQMKVGDGQLVSKGQELLHLSGLASAILTGERTALNLLGRLCGI